MIKLHDNCINGILADEMGLGKTLQTISLLGYLRESRNIYGPHIVIVPKSVVSNWLREFNRWCPEIKTVRLQGSKEERAKVVKEEIVTGKFDVVVVSYESLLKESSKLLKFKWKYVISDIRYQRIDSLCLDDYCFAMFCCCRTPYLVVH